MYAQSIGEWLYRCLLYLATTLSFMVTDQYKTFAIGLTPGEDYENYIHYHT